MGIKEFLFPQPLLYTRGVSLSPGNRIPNFTGSPPGNIERRAHPVTAPDWNSYDFLGLAPATIHAPNTIVLGFNDGGVAHVINEGAGDH